MVKEKRKHELLYTKATHTFFAGYPDYADPWVLVCHQLFLNLFRPAMSPAISNAFAHMDKDAQAYH